MIPWFYCRIEFLRYVPLNIQHRQVRSSNVWVKLLQTDMTWSTCSRLVQKKGGREFSCGNAWPFLAFLVPCGRWGHVFATSAILRSCKKKKRGHATFFFLFVGENIIPKCVTNRIDDASGICWGEIFRPLVSTKNTRNRTDLPLRQLEIRLRTRNTSRDISPYRPRLVPLPFPLFLKVVSLLLPTGNNSATRKVPNVPHVMEFDEKTEKK